MYRKDRMLRTILLALFAVAMPVATAQISVAADMPEPSPFEQTVPALTQADYLEHSADLMMLRLRFSALLEDEARESMRTIATDLGQDQPDTHAISVLRRDLTAELFYYVVNLKYLIMAEGAIWPEDKPARTYKNDALSALAEISGELATGDVLVLDIDDILHRLERINAWTEGATEPADDWFDPKERQHLIDEAVEAAGAMTTQT